MRACYVWKKQQSAFGSSKITRPTHTMNTMGLRDVLFVWFFIYFQRGFHGDDIGLSVSLLSFLIILYSSVHRHYLLESESLHYGEPAHS